ncbi:hypothetical protein CPB83DRAFT_840216 [Crepidotus variabilis]|uniref:Uncharacterized protein n=1 Tax=Crepidotus variabilis TaxID=179855 RepID=A0A9P6E5C3_9AGAR|nr:hypothetical protein CPB83DRAFT_840216 [Crepidotus variabilis]
MVDSAVENHAYMGNDVPQSWPISTGQEVIMQFEDTRRFALEDSEEANEQWMAQYPNKGVINLGINKEPFTIGMFHEIRCIDIIRKELLRLRPNETSHGTQLNTTSLVPRKVAMHCLNYLRQMILCRADNNPEPTFRGSSPPLPLLYRCNDWTKVYEAVERNQEAKTKPDAK